jgi:hypothetical protein
VKPQIFPEQIQRLHPFIPQVLSIEDFKIDYSQFLGSGCFGKVYALIPRPDDEINSFSRWIPYIYDRIYPAKSNGENEHCIKISYSFIECIIREIYTGNGSALNVFWEKSIQNESATLRYQYGVSQIHIYSTNSWYSQIKSRVNGHTLYHYMETGELLDKKNYLMRKTFIDFLWAITSTPLNHNDLHAENIMYDIKYQRWEIVDGSTEKDCGYRTASARMSAISKIKFDLLKLTPATTEGKRTHALLNFLINKAIEIVSGDEFSNCNYDEFTDRQCLLQAMREFITPKEFHFFNPAKKIKVGAKKARVEAALLRMPWAAR